MFTPPVVSNINGPLGTLMAPSQDGGTNWQGGSFDPETKMLYTFSVTTPTALGLMKSDGSRSDMNYISGQARDPRTADGPGRIVDSRAQDGVRVETQPEPGQAGDHPADAVEPPLPLLGQEHAEGRGPWIDEIAEDMNVGFIADGGDLDARDEFDVRRFARPGGRLAAGHRIVIRDAQHRDARRGRARDELGRSAAAVRRRGVRMKIDQRRRCRRAATAGRAGVL